MNELADAEQEQLTALLIKAARGDEVARNELYPRVYDEMHRLAVVHMSREQQGHTLQPTALLHEAYLRLIEVKNLDWVSRGHFYAVAAKVMRRVLISHARSRQAKKRGGELRRIDLDHAPILTNERDPILIALDSALSRLELESPRAYRLVELRFFAGLDFEEAALALNVSSRTLKRDWEAAKRWLYREIENDRVKE